MSLTKRFPFPSSANSLGSSNPLPMGKAKSRPLILKISYTLLVSISETKTSPAPSTAMPSGKLKPLSNWVTVGLAGMTPPTAKISQTEPLSASAK